MKNEVKHFFDDYDFLSLYCFTKISKGDSEIVDNEKLGNILFYFYDDPKYKELFENMKLDSEDNFIFIDLHKAFAYAYSCGLLNLTVDSSGVKAEITVSKEEARIIMRDFFRPEEVKAMDSLYEEVKEKEKVLSKLIQIRKLATEIKLAEQLIEVNKKLQLELEEEINKEQEKIMNEEMKRIRKKDTNK